MSDHGPYLVVIAGPTAVGKTAVSIEIAKLYKTSIINADSRQIYKELDIGVAKPSLEELEEVPHHFVNHCSIHDTFTASDFEQQSISMLEQLYEKVDVVVMSGGTGLYIQAVLEGFDKIPDVSESYVSELNEAFKNKGITHLQNRLKQCDPDYYDTVDKYNYRRLIRAISVFDAHNKPYSSYLSKTSKSRSFKPILVQLDRDREELYKRINNRVDMMIADGLENEAKSFYAYRDLRALQTMGYIEFFKNIDGDLTKAEAISLIKQQSRRYAKRQLTWYRKRGNWKVIPADNFSEIVHHIKEKIYEL